VEEHVWFCYRLKKLRSGEKSEPKESLATPVGKKILRKFFRLHKNKMARALTHR
jgi:hypothetical protein